MGWPYMVFPDFCTWVCETLVIWYKEQGFRHQREGPGTTRVNVRILQKGKGTQCSQQKGPHQSAPMPSATGGPTTDDQVQRVLASASRSERGWGLGEKNNLK